MDGPAASPEAPAVDFVRLRRARRYIVRVRPDGTVRVTIPRGGSRREADVFLQRHERWVERERARNCAEHAPRRWGAGSRIMLRGIAVTIDAVAAHDRILVTYGDRRIEVPGQTHDFRPAIERDLRRLAETELPARLLDVAAPYGLAVRRVTVRDQRSRWGSCSRTGNIALNFRLVQMPPAISDYVLLHELMHLKHQNHSRKYWKLVEAACPDFRAAERWLRIEGKSLF